MADQILDQVRDLAEGQIAIAFFVGFFKQDIKLALAFGLLGTIFTFAIVVPPWPFYKKHPVRWLPLGGRDASTQEIVVDGKTVG
ncbi:hypothetical protein BofuT4_uP015560.1 [Botrytis cinerea T4]|uniref:Signal peptidase complex subunit 1 n=1 Tax=Botryotinia fuckeliana (strain T4) TaxID=999810 RepID=G2YHR3_BOTF4|nr:hypothetical protein BofuT4_uP015560.1 [Botrytis cinerea T4]